MTISSIPYRTQTFEVAFDFLDHTLWIQSSDGARLAMGLYARSVADFYREFMGLLRSLGSEVTINPLSREVADPIRCDEDEEHAAYHPASATRLAYTAPVGARAAAVPRPLYWQEQPRSTFSGAASTLR